MKIQTIDLSEEISREDCLDARLIVAVDSSQTDAGHDRNIDRLIHLTREIPVPFFAKGHLKRLEDVKRFLYAGAKKVIFEEGEEELAAEAAARFGPEKVTFEPVEVSEPEPAFSWDDMKTNADGLVPVITQDCRSGQVLMLAYMNRESYEATLRTGRMTYFSRSRQELWEKGDTSGHFQYMRSLDLDCDNDTILARVIQLGAACHTGNYSCFYRPIVEEEYPETNPYTVLEDVYGVIEDRREHPKEGSYTNYLFDKGLDKILKKLGEEATEITIAAKNPNPEEVIYELSDFLYHASVLLVEKGVTWQQIIEELAKR